MSHGAPFILPAHRSRHVKQPGYYSAAPGSPVQTPQRRRAWHTATGSNGKSTSTSRQQRSTQGASASSNHAAHPPRAQPRTRPRPTRASALRAAAQRRRSADRLSRERAAAGPGAGAGAGVGAGAGAGAGRRTRGRRARASPARRKVPATELDQKLQVALKKLQSIKEHYKARPATAGPARNTSAGSATNYVRQHSASKGRLVPSPDAAGARPKTSASTGATPASRLQTAEAIIAKLYARIKDLEERLAAAAQGGGGGGGGGGAAGAAAAPQRPPTSASFASSAPQSPTGTWASGTFDFDDEEMLGADEDTSAVEDLLHIHVEAEKRLQHQLETRDAQIKQLRTALEAVRAPEAGASQQAAAAEAASAALNQENVELRKRLKTAVDEAGRYQRAAVKARADYRKVVAARVKKATGYGGPVTGAARDLLTALGERLTSSEAERQEEAAAYNRRLMEAEQQHCDWFVEKRLMEERMNSLMSEIKERDAMEDKMEMCVHSLFERVKQLEVGNHRLKAKLAAMRGLRTPMPDATTPGTSLMRTPTPIQMRSSASTSPSSPDGGAVGTVGTATAAAVAATAPPQEAPS